MLFKDILRSYPLGCDYIPYSTEERCLPSCSGGQGGDRLPPAPPCAAGASPGDPGEPRNPEPGNAEAEFDEWGKEQINLELLEESTHRDGLTLLWNILRESAALAEMQVELKKLTKTEPEGRYVHTGTPSKLMESVDTSATLDTFQ
jgi:hypothetical protein